MLEKGLILIMPLPTEEDLDVKIEKFVNNNKTCKNTP